MSMLSDLITGSASNFLGALLLALFLFFLSVPFRVLRWISVRINSRKILSRMRAGIFDRATIERSLKNYIKPHSSSIDPSLEEEPRNSLVVVREPLFSVINKLIDDKSQKKKYILLLADSGMGKTSFFLNYFNYRNGSIKFKTRVFLVLLSDPSSDEKIKSISQNDRGEIDLFLDALDEDGRAKYRTEDRIRELLSIAYGFNSVVISCRTQFFRSERDVPEDTQIYKIGPVGLNESKSYIFRRVYISPFDDKQIDKYLNKVYSGIIFYPKRRYAKKIIKKIPSLSVRPMLLTHIPEVIKSKREIRKSCDLYEIMIDAWLKRESHWIKPESLRDFSERLAFDMLANSSDLNGYGVTFSEIEEYCKKNGFEIDFGNLTSRSLLNRGMQDRFKFSHRSIMEYLAVDYIYRNKISDIDLTDQMYFFLIEKVGMEYSSAMKMKGVAKTKFVPDFLYAGHLSDKSLFDIVGYLGSVVIESPIVSEFNGEKLEQKSTIILVSEHIVKMLRVNGYSGLVYYDLRIFGSDFGKKTKCQISFYTTQLIVVSSLTLDFNDGFSDEANVGASRIVFDAYNKLNYFFRGRESDFIGLICSEYSGVKFYGKTIFTKHDSSSGGKIRSVALNGAVSWSRLDSNRFYLNILATANYQERQWLSYGFFGNPSGSVVKEFGSPRVIKKLIG